MTNPTAGMQARRLYGKYRGKVLENIDPLVLGRLIAEVPALPTSLLNWAITGRAICRAAGGLLHHPADRRERLDRVRGGRPQPPDLERLLLGARRSAARGAAAAEGL